MSNQNASAVDLEKLAGIVNEARGEQEKKLGKVNIIVAGRTGAGKSTLVNAIFGTEFAETAMGRPVTRHATWHERDGHPLRILDTKGLETSEYAATWKTLQDEITKGRNSPDPSNLIHIGWVCVQEPGLRFEDAERKLVEALKNQKIPTIVVLTKHGLFPEFREKVAELADKADAIVPVRARPMLPGFPDVSGLEELVQATFRLLPDATRDAFVAAQQVDLRLKQSAARKIIVGAATAAGTAAAVPLPFSGAIVIVPIQIGMILGISAQFGICGSKKASLNLAVSIVGCIAATAAGRIIVGQLLNFIPGLSLINAAVAATLTDGLGEAYLAFLVAFRKRSGRVPTPDEIPTGFRDFWKTWNNKGEPKAIAETAVA